MMHSTIENTLGCDRLRATYRGALFSIESVDSLNKACEDRAREIGADTLTVMRNGASKDLNAAEAAALKAGHSECLGKGACLFADPSVVLVERQIEAGYLVSEP